MGGPNPSRFSSCGDDCPVESVSWEEAVAFCEKLSEQEGLSGPRAYRLPTEAEWERAARVGGDTPYAGGYHPNAVGWTSDNAGGKIYPVGERLPNDWGLFDMTGNVWEWVEDWYDSGYYSRSPRWDPVNTQSASNRVLRGGSWSDAPAFARVAFRGWNDPGYRYGDLGFRLARSE